MPRAGMTELCPLNTLQGHERDISIYYTSETAASAPLGQDMKVIFSLSTWCSQHRCQINRSHINDATVEYWTFCRGDGLTREGGRGTQEKSG